MMLIVDFIVMLFVLQLTIFHCWLRWHNLTTFEFITIQREFEELKEKEINEQSKLKSANQSGATSNLIHSGYTHITGGIKESALKQESTNKNIINSEDNNQDFVHESLSIKSKNLLLKFKKKTGESTFEKFHNLNSIK